MGKSNDFIKFIMASNIIMVVAFHKGINFFEFIYFPGDTFRIPLFVVIGGYLFKDKYINDIVSYVSKKIKCLMLPYYFLNSLYGMLCCFMRDKNIIQYGVKVDLMSLIVYPFIDGLQFGLNTSMWFVPQLFTIQVLYIIIRKAVIYIPPIQQIFVCEKFHIVNNTDLYWLLWGYLC